MSGELSDGGGEFGWCDDRNRGGESDASDGHGEPSEVLAADFDQTRLRVGLDKCVVHPSEHSLEFAERGAYGESRFVVAGY